MCSRPLIFVSVTALLALAGQAPAQFCKFKVIGKVGQAGLTGRESGV